MMKLIFSDLERGHLGRPIRLCLLSGIDSLIVLLKKCSLFSWDDDVTFSISKLDMNAFGLRCKRAGSLI